MCRTVESTARPLNQVVDVVSARHLVEHGGNAEAQVAEQQARHEMAALLQVTLGAVRNVVADLADEQFDVPAGGGVPVDRLRRAAICSRCRSGRSRL